MLKIDSGLLPTLKITIRECLVSLDLHNICFSSIKQMQNSDVILKSTFNGFYTPLCISISQRYLNVCLFLYKIITIPITIKWFVLTF